MGYFFFFFQAEDGIRDYKVTGVQTCALPISPRGSPPSRCARPRIVPDDTDVDWGGMNPLALTSFTATSCIGRGVAATLATLRERRTGPAPCAFESVTLDTWVGEVAGVDEAPLPARLRELDRKSVV